MGDEGPRKVNLTLGAYPVGDDGPKMPHLQGHTVMVLKIISLQGQILPYWGLGEVSKDSTLLRADSEGITCGG